MTPNPRPPRRPVVGSRNPTARPRKVAGRIVDPALEDASVDDAPVEDAPDPDPDPDSDPAPTEGESAAEERPGVVRRMLAARRATGVLVALVLLLGGALVAEGWFLWLRDDPVVSAERPVVTGEIAHRAAVEAASQSTTEILSYGYQDFDAQIEESASKMTDTFAAQFEATAADVKDEFVENRTEQEVKVVAASVVQASAQQVRALLFMDQYVARAGKGTAVTPYRALVTVVHTDSGWLVSDIQTQ